MARSVSALLPLARGFSIPWWDAPAVAASVCGFFFFFFFFFSP